MSERPNPKAFPTEGPDSMRFTAYDPGTFDVCSDEDCRCRSAKGNVRGFGSTEQEALADFWEQWEDKQAEEIDRMREQHYDTSANT